MKSFIKEFLQFDLFNEDNQKYLDYILDNTYYYPFISKGSYSSINTDLLKIYIRGIPANEVLKIENFLNLYVFNLVCLLHELFHYYFSAMRYITKGNKIFNSPAPKKPSPYAKKKVVNQENGLRKNFWVNVFKT